MENQTVKKDLKIDEKTVIYCRTKKEERNVGFLLNKLGYPWWNKDSCWSVYKEKTCISPSYGFDSIDHYEKHNYTIISAKDFLKLHKENVDKEKKDTKIYYRGDSKRGEEIIKALKDLGGENSLAYKGADKNNYYFINRWKEIASVPITSEAAWLLTMVFTEMFLPEIPIKTIVIDGKVYESTETLESLIETLKESKNEKS